MTALIWAKMQAESGETLEQIILRKEAERHSGNGVFWWGFGASLGDDVERAANENGYKLPVLFSKMLSPPKKKDSAPSLVCVWDGWQTNSGQGRIPPDILVTGGNLTRGHHALVCSSPTSIEIRNHSLFDPANCWTYKSGNNQGAEKNPGRLRW